MSRDRVYLDHNATTPVRIEARTALLSAIEAGGNPSSVHREGRRARATIEAARTQVAALFGARPDRLCFTSGGTEAANLVLHPRVRRAGAFSMLYVGACEHAAVLKGHRFETAEILPVDRHGRIDLERLETRLAGSGPAMLAVQAANNETGVLQPLTEAARLVHAKDGWLVCDAVQMPGRIRWTAADYPVDAVFLSGHKLGAGPGAGALVCFGDDVAIDVPLLRGGGQERGLRAGTENVPAIAAFGAAAALVRDAPEAPALLALRDRFETGLMRLAPEAVVFGAGVPRLPNTSAFAVPDLTAEVLMMALDLGGIAVSSGSACSSGKVGRSHVLEAMGVAPDLRAGAIRVSFGWTSTEADVDAVLDVLSHTFGRLTKRGMRAAAKPAPACSAMASAFRPPSLVDGMDCLGGPQRQIRAS